MRFFKTTFVFIFIHSLLILAAALARADILDNVNPMIGVIGPGSCIPGPCLPNGSIHPSPNTFKPGNGGYLANQPISGFSQLHAQGSGGQKSYGNFLLSPQINLETDEPKHTSPIDHELARADSYSAHLARYNITAAVTPTAHAALYQFTFPKSDAATLAIDVARKLDKPAVLDEGSVHIDPATSTITGGGHFTSNWNPAPYTLYFALQVSKPPASLGTWQNTKTNPNVADAITKKNQRLGAYLQWSTAENEIISVKIAISFTSVAQAKKYLDEEIPAWDFEKVQANAAAQWTAALGVITLDPATPSDEQKKFYTALYHTMIQPRNRTGDNPNWQSDAPFYDDYYTLWDSWRTLFPLMAITTPNLLADNINAFIDRHAHNGHVNTAFTQGKEMKTGQGGDEVDNIIADAYLKNIPNVDWQKAYALLKDDADTARTPDYLSLGYVADDIKHNYDWRLKSASSTLAFAYNDFCASEVAQGLGKTEDAKKYLSRSANWKNIWDDNLIDLPSSGSWLPASGFSGFAGFPHGRHANGHFMQTLPTAGYNTDFYEGTCWVFSYGIPGDVPAMIQKMGGPSAFTTRLQYALHANLIDFTNEPSFNTLWWFDAAHRPDLASYWTDKLKSLYTTDGYPGDEDNGAMSSLYVFLTAGIYPIAGQNLYYLHGPHVPQLTFHLPNGKTFTITAQNQSAKNIYIQSATLNGKPLTVPFIHHADIFSGGTLNFILGPTPSTWGQLQ